MGFAPIKSLKGHKWSSYLLHIILLATGNLLSALLSIYKASHSLGRRMLNLWRIIIEEDH